MTVTATQAIQNFKNNPHGPPQSVADGAANVGALLDGLQTLTAASALQSVVFTDPSPPTLSLTAAQLTEDAGTIARFYYNQSSFIYVSAVAANGIPVGSDSSGSGSTSSPFATIARAEASLRPGQTVLLNGLAANPTAYVASPLTVSNTGIDCVQAFGARITVSGSNSAVLYVEPATGGTIKVGQVVIDGGNTVESAVALAASPTGLYGVVFNGTRIENFATFGVLAEATNVSATFTGASFNSQAGARSAIYFEQMASGALDVESTTFDITQSLQGYGAAIEAVATHAGPTVKVNNSTISVKSVSGNTAGSYHYGIRLINVHGAVIDNNNITIDASASPGWGAKPISISTTLDATALDSGGFVVANNTLYAATSLSMSGIAIGEEGDQPATRGLFNGGLIYGNTISSSPAAQLAEAQGIFVGSEANTVVYGNSLTGLGIGIVDKNGNNAVYYGNTIKNCAIDNVLLKGSTHATVVNNNIFTGDGVYDVYGIHVETNPVTAYPTVGSIISGNYLVSAASANPRFVQVDAGQGVALSANAYFSTAPLAYESWQWQGRAEPTYGAWQAASGEFGGAYTEGTSSGGTLNPYPIPINSVAPLTPTDKSVFWGLRVSAVTAANAAAVAAMPNVVGVAVLDSAAKVAADLNSLEALASAGELTSIAFTDSSTPTLALGASALIADAAALNVISSPYALSATGGVTALQALKLSPTILSHLSSGLAIYDSGGNFTSFLDQLQNLAAAGRVDSIHLTGGTPTLAITASQLVADATVLARIEGSHDLLLSGTLDYSGPISLAASTTLLVGTAGVALSGGGTIDLGASGTGSLLGVATSATLTNVDDKVVGAGQIGVGRMTLVNESAGVIDANEAGALTIDTAGVIVVNAGLIEATGAGGLTVLDTTIDSSRGGVILAGGGSHVELLRATLIGGTLESTGNGVFTTRGGGNALDGTASAVNIQTTLIVADNTNLTLQGALNNTGEIGIASQGAGATLIIGPGNASLTGGGRLLLTDSALNRVVGASSAATLTNVDNTVTGAGSLGAGRLTLVNQANGVIIGSLSTALILNTGSNTIANAGLILSRGVGGVTIASSIANSGILEAGGGMLTVNGAVSGSGEGVIAAGGLDFASSFSQRVIFKGAAGVLELGQSQGYTGVVLGFSKSGGTSLDLRDIGFVSSTEATFKGSASGGVLTVTDGTQTARIHLRGDYRASTFTASSDGHGGTIVVDPAAPPAVHRFIAAAASLGAGGGGLVNVADEARRAHPPMLARPGVIAA